MSVSLLISCWWCSREDLSRTWHREVTQKPSNNHNIRLHLTNPNPLIFSIHKNKKFILLKFRFIPIPTIPQTRAFLPRIARFSPSETCKEKAHRGHRWANKSVIKKNFYNCLGWWTLVSGLMTYWNMNTTYLRGRMSCVVYLAICFLIHWLKSFWSMPISFLRKAKKSSTVGFVLNARFNAS